MLPIKIYYSDNNYWLGQECNILKFLNFLEKYY